jgi:rod shape-determining protein MreC
VRVATLPPPSQRPAAQASLPSRAQSVGRRRAVVALLVVASLALLSIYFRESDGGRLHSLQSSGAAVLRPFEVAGDRVARPFEDASSWFGGLLHAKSENAKLRKQLDAARQVAIQHRNAVLENGRLRKLLAYRDSASFPKDYRGLAAAVLSRPPSQLSQQIVVAVGSNDGVVAHAPVVTEDGLVGLVTRVGKNQSLVTLLTDETSNVSVVDLRTQASGILRSGTSVDRVTKDQVVKDGDTLVTAGWHDGPLSSLYPKGIPVGTVISAGQSDVAVYKTISVAPFVDFSALQSVLVLVPTTPPR